MHESSAGNLTNPKRKTISNDTTLIDINVKYIWTAINKSMSWRETWTFCSILQRTNREERRKPPVFPNSKSCHCKALRERGRGSPPGALNLREQKTDNTFWLWHNGRNIEHQPFILERTTSCKLQHYNMCVQYTICTKPQLQHTQRLAHLQT